MSVEFRDATGADAAPLKDLFETVFCETFGHLYRPEDLDSFLSDLRTSDWEKQLTDPAYAVRIAEHEGAPVAFVKLGPVTIPAETTGPTLLLHQIYVLKDHQGTGIARALMDWALAESARRKARELLLTVYIENDRARRLYERYGFEVVGRYDFMVGNQADHDVVMRKQV